MMNNIQENIVKYNDAVQTIKTAILQGQYEAVKGVNRIQLAVYFAIGKYISQHTRKGVWGEGALAVISDQLSKELPGLRGYSENSLKNMRKFYEAWQVIDASQPKSTIAIVDSAQSNSTTTIVEIAETLDIHLALSVSNIAEFPIEDFFRVPFTHHVRIIEGVEDAVARCYYIQRAAHEFLPVRKLQQIIREDAYHHQGQLPNNFSLSIGNPTQARKAVDMFKDEYLLDFINVEEIGVSQKMDVDERVIEQQIVQNIKDFIMTFGHDFAFVGNQYHLEIYGVEQFPDLLFFNRELNALVVIELKKGPFKSAYLGQLFGYLQILDDKVRKPHENHSIGIILCQEADHAYAEYAVRDYSKPMGVATYKTLDDMPEPLRNALPDMKEAMKLIGKK